jgi:hypothetical protein
MIYAKEKAIMIQNHENPIQGYFYFDGKFYPAEKLIKFCEGKDTSEIYVDPKYFSSTTVEQAWGHVGVFPDGTIEYRDITMADLAKHIPRILKADYVQFPIITHITPKGTYQILDGRHRYLHAYIDKQTCIQSHILNLSEMREFTQQYSTWAKLR